VSASKKPVTNGQLFQTKREVVQAVDGVLAGFMAKQKAFETRVAKVEADALANRDRADRDFRIISDSLVSAAVRIDALECRVSQSEKDLRTMGALLHVASSWVNAQVAWASLPWWRRWFTRRPR
jgi:hypothetical protein